MRFETSFARPVVFFMIVIGGLIFCVSPVRGQGREEPGDEGKESKEEPSRDIAPPPEIDAKTTGDLPWFIMAGRMAMGGGSGSVTFEWDFFNGLVRYKEDVDLKNVSTFAFIPEAFFMPTKARRFIISASLPIGGGTGTMESDEIFDGEEFSYSFVFLNLGLGYQWFFGDTETTNLILMTHLGRGNYTMGVELEDETRSTDSLAASYFDVSIGMTRRFANNLVFGGTMDLWGMAFQGDAGSEGVVDADADGQLAGIRLNMLLGYAF